mgnify:CR=1 FL=1
MSFIGGGATNGQAWLDFLGTLKDKRFPPIGSPIQINFRWGGVAVLSFPSTQLAGRGGDGSGTLRVAAVKRCVEARCTSSQFICSGFLVHVCFMKPLHETAARNRCRPENATPPGLSPLADRVVACGDNAFRCSCSDCPAAQGCAQVGAGASRVRVCAARAARAGGYAVPVPEHKPLLHTHFASSPKPLKSSPHPCSNTVTDSTCFAARITFWYFHARSLPLQPAPEPPAPPPACHVGSLRCLTFALIWVYAAVAACVLAGYVLGLGAGSGAAAAAAAAAAEAEASTGAEAGAGGGKERAAWGVAAGWEQDGLAGGGGGEAGASGLRQPLLHGGAGASGGGGTGSGGGAGGGGGGGGHRPPRVERLLQRGYYRLVRVWGKSVCVCVCMCVWGGGGCCVTALRDDVMAGAGRSHLPSQPASRHTHTAHTPTRSLPPPARPHAATHPPARLPPSPRCRVCLWATTQWLWRLWVWRWRGCAA